MKPGPLGAYTLHRRLASGGMGHVWAASHTTTGLPVAIKILKPDVTVTPGMTEIFDREVRTLAGLDHPNIAMLLDHGTSEDGPWLAMEYCSGGTLAQLYKTLDWPGIRRVILALLDALAHAHARDVLHLDIKLANVLYAGADDLRPGLKLVDFGIANLGSDGPESFVPTGTLRYMAPEQLAGEWHALGPWTDLYTLGTMIWRIVTHEVPFKGLPRTALLQAVSKSAFGWPGPAVPLPDGFRAWLDRLLANDPVDRFQLAADAAAALAELEEEDPTIEPVPLVKSSHRGVRAAVTHLGLREPLEKTPEGLQLTGIGATLLHWRRPAIVGRVEERQRLWELLQRVRSERRCATAQIVGPRGIGRSRLADWFGEAAETTGQALRLRVERGTRGGIVPRVLHALRRFFRVHDDAPAQVHAQVRSWLGPGEITDLLPAALLDPGSVSDEALDVLVGALALLAEHRPLAVLIDHTDDAVLDLITAARERDAPIVFVVVGDGRHDLGDLRIELEPLSTRYVQQVLAGLLPLAPAVAEDLARRSAGSPGFATLVLHHWNDTDALRTGPDGFVTEATEALPPTAAVVATVQRQHLCFRLTEAGLDAVDIAAAMGPEIDGDAWQDAYDRLHPNDPSWYQVLRRMLEERQLIETATGWRFASAALHQELLGAIRDPVHTHTVCAKAWSYLQTSPLEVGRHLLAAGKPREALGPLFEGMLNLRGRHAMESAAVFLDLPTKAIAQLDDPEDREFWSCRLLLERARVRSGDPGEPLAERGLAQAQALRDPYLLFLAHSALGQALFDRRQLQDSLAHFDAAVEHGYHAGRAEVVKLQIRRSVTLKMLGDPTGAIEALEISQRLLAESPDDPNVPWVEGRLAQLKGDWPGMAAGGSEYVRQAERALHVERVAFGLAMRAYAQSKMGDKDAAREDFLRASAICDIVARPLAAAAHLANAITMDLETDQLERAVRTWDHHRQRMNVTEDAGPAGLFLHLTGIACEAAAQRWERLAWHLDAFELPAVGTDLDPSLFFVRVAAEQTQKAGKETLFRRLVALALAPEGALDTENGRAIQALTAPNYGL